MECMLTAGGVGYNYNLGHLNRWDSDIPAAAPEAVVH
jgi:hypothetical protein